MVDDLRAAPEPLTQEELAEFVEVCGAVFLSGFTPREREVAVHVARGFKLKLAAERERRERAEEERDLGHVRINECAGTEGTRDKPLYDRIGFVLTRAEYRRAEEANLRKADVAEGEILRVRTEAAEHRRAAAAYRVADVELRLELLDADLASARQTIARQVVSLGERQRSWAEMRDKLKATETERDDLRRKARDVVEKLDRCALYGPADRAREAVETLRATLAEGSVRSPEKPTFPEMRMGYDGEIPLGASEFARREAWRTAHWWRRFVPLHIATRRAKEESRS